jgi:hypothetical protein
MPRPTLVLFDVNETLSDLHPLRARFEEVGAPGQLLGSGSRAPCATALPSPRPAPIPSSSSSRMRRMRHSAALLSGCSQPELATQISRQRAFAPDRRPKTHRSERRCPRRGSLRGLRLSSKRSRHSLRPLQRRRSADQRPSESCCSLVPPLVTRRAYPAPTARVRRAAACGRGGFCSSRRRARSPALRRPPHSRAPQCRAIRPPRGSRRATSATAG